MNASSDDIIDLTTSITCTLVNHCLLSNTVIDLDTTDEIYESPVKINLTNLKRTSNSQCENIPTKKKSVEKSISFGECPICWEQLGKKPMASTKCGHVYCVTCLEKSLKTNKTCPKCRTSLKGKTAYHRLYLFDN